MTDWGRGLARFLAQTGVARCFGFRVANYREPFVIEIFHKDASHGNFNPGAATEPGQAFFLDHERTVVFVPSKFWSIQQEKYP